ncbi:MAG: NTP transferase domain-containing protein [Gemmatimonadota bacterium]|jgi:mannose-1-phosphate guanylyltransferase|nr:NTP transferase domain-containing protein [Gemmatimonadota bacterium]
MKSSPDPHLWAVILAGGIGSRFWPASTPSRPKQLLPLASELPLITETVQRIEPLIPIEQIRILTGAELAGPIASAVPELRDENFLLEPRAAGTAPILAWAALEIGKIDPDAVMVSLHADHVIHPRELFRERIALAASVAVRNERLVTLGAVPDRPETGFGYIRPGEPLPPVSDHEPSEGFTVDRFVEKPDSETACEYLRQGNYLWNTGIFIWRVRDLITQFERHTPEIAELFPSLREGNVQEFFRRVPVLSIDNGLLERSDRVAVVPADFRWDDIGSWDALFRTRLPDAAGNVSVGDVHLLDTQNTAVYSDSGPVVAFGVQDLVVVRTAGVTFVMPRQLSAELKRLHEYLPERLRKLE